MMKKKTGYCVLWALCCSGKLVSFYHSIEKAVEDNCKYQNLHLVKLAVDADSWEDAQGESNWEDVSYDDCGDDCGELEERWFIVPEGPRRMSVFKKYTK